MEVILLERVEKLGHMGEVVKVKDGFARNFLLPQSKALRATAENKARFERERETLVKLNDERKAQAHGGASKLDGTSYVLLRQASETLQLYGSVSARDIADAVSTAGTAISRAQVRLDKPIKTLGVHDVRVALHPEVIITVKVNVARSAEEAEIQAKGGVIQAVGQDRAAAAEFAAEVASATAEADAGPAGDAA
ncbi:MAG: 50S ribosomal protein L9 [Alphaproteobacteria bacterium]|nr:50S ribosomal protein L9 [Alphaproteobacteria bacterium]